MNYGKVYHFGHRDVRGILDKPVYVEEKIDGSQFSFGVTLGGELWCASKNKLLDLNTEDKLFKKAIATVEDLQVHLATGAVYRGEAVCAPRHNKLAYGRAPEKGLVLFDVQYCDGLYVSRGTLEDIAEELDLEIVPCLASGALTQQQVLDLVDGPAYLGKCGREGIVIKSQDTHNRLKCKIVSDGFRETKRLAKLKGSHSVGSTIEQYRTEARWDKAIQHLREDGALTGTPKDIPAVLREIARDLKDECEDEIKEVLWPKLWKEIVKGVSQGAPEYYLKELDQC